MKKIFSSLILIGLTASILIKPALATNFPDVSEYHQYANEIQYINDNGFVDGFSDGTYKPDQSITRAEFTKIVINAKFDETTINTCMEQNYRPEYENLVFNEDESIFYIEELGEYRLGNLSINGEPFYNEVFPDIPAGVIKNKSILSLSVNFDEFNKFTKYLCIAKTNQIVKGYQDGEFKPENNITYGEALKIAVRTLDSQQNIDKDADLWQYMNRMDQFSARPQTIGETEKDKILTRGEVAHIIQRVNSNYTLLELEPLPSKASYQFIIKRGETHNIPEEGLDFRTRNFGIHCTTSDKNTFIDLDVTKEGNTQQIHLERSCTGLSGGAVEGQSTHEADLYGYHFRLEKVEEKTAWDVDSFEYTISVIEN